jgi:hypothetical protein
MYIPKDLDDCFVQLEKTLRPGNIAHIRNATKDDLSLEHFGLGLWMRNNWGLWGRSRLAEWFNARGVTDPDEMSSAILRSFRRHLRGEQVDELPGTARQFVLPLETN